MTDQEGPDRPTEDAGRTEDDVHRDEAAVRARPLGGADDAEGPDAEGTTGAGVSGSFVGRDAGQDVGYAGETGAERRAGS